MRGEGETCIDAPEEETRHALTHGYGGERCRGVWVPEILAAEFRKFWLPPETLPQREPGRLLANSASCSSSSLDACTLGSKRRVPRGGVVPSGQRSGLRRHRLSSRNRRRCSVMIARPRNQWTGSVSSILVRASSTRCFVSASAAGLARAARRAAISRARSVSLRAALMMCSRIMMV